MKGGSAPGAGSLCPRHDGHGARRVRILGTVLLGLVLLSGCGGSQGPVAGEEYSDMVADNVITNARYLITSHGIRQAVLLADTAYGYEDQSRFELRGVHLTIFDETGEESAILTSEEGELDAETNATVARGDVVLITHEDGARTESEVLYYEPELDRIWSDTPTTRYVGDSTLRGDGFSADARLHNLKLEQPRGSAPGVEIDF